MQKFTSKHVTAIGITPRIDEYKRDLIQELLDGTNPTSFKRTTYDTGTKKKTILDQSPVGPNETGAGDDRLSHDNVGSGYDKGIDPGGRADDETGPGYTPNRDPEQEFTSPDTVNRIFGNDDNLSDKFSPLNTDSRKRDQNITHHLRRLHSRPWPVQSLPSRAPVDELVKRRHASSNWTHVYV